VFNTATHLLTKRNTRFEAYFLQITLIPSVALNSFFSTMASPISSPFLQNVVRECPVLKAWLSFHLTKENLVKMSEFIFQVKWTPRSHHFTSKQTHTQLPVPACIAVLSPKMWKVYCLGRAIGTWALDIGFHQTSVCRFAERFFLLTSCWFVDASVTLWIDLRILLDRVLTVFCSVNENVSFSYCLG
jgi:hypothetical protein